MTGILEVWFDKEGEMTHSTPPKLGFMERRRLRKSPESVDFRGRMYRLNVEAKHYETGQRFVQYTPHE